MASWVLIPVVWCSLSVFITAASKARHILSENKSVLVQEEKGRRFRRRLSSSPEGTGDKRRSRSWEVKTTTGEAKRREGPAPVAVAGRRSKKKQEVGGVASLPVAFSVAR